MNEYVGPARFQFPDERLPLMNSLLSVLPESHRRSLRNGIVQAEVVPAGRRRTSTRSTHRSRFAPTRSWGSSNERFEIVYQADFGGTLLQFVLADIAGNFDPAEPSDVALINLICLYEKTLIEQGVLPSDFTYVVAKTR